MTDITLFWCPRTRASRSVWLLEELGVPYTLATINVQDETARSAPEFRAASPMGKVPALRHGDVTLTDSAAIALYLADRFPEAGLAPALDAPERAKYVQWMIVSPGYLEPSMAEKFGSTTPNRASHGWGDYATTLDMVRDGLNATSGPWILGEAFSAADTMIGSTLNFMRMFGILEPDSTFDPYIDRCCARPAFIKAQALDATEL